MTLCLHRLPWIALQRPVGVKLENNEDCLGEPPFWPASLKLVQRRIPDSDSKVSAATTVTYYNAKLGADLIIITPDDDDSAVLYDLELDSRQSYYPATRTCTVVNFYIGILRRDWITDAMPMPDDDGGTCAWTKADFIDYYTDKNTNRPTRWYFRTMKATFETLEYEENQFMNSSLFMPPDNCFQGEE